MKKFLIYLTVIAFSITSSGCATLFSGSKEEVSLSSEPSGAKVLVNGHNRGKTPLTLNLKKSKEYNIEFVKDGYETKNISLTYSLGAGWLILDILFGLIPIIVDAATGNWNGLDYDSYKAHLEPKN